MGFWVQVHSEHNDYNANIISLLSKKPSQLFSVSRQAYILFLFSEHDKEQLDWLMANVKILDSLTGQDISYAICTDLALTQKHTLNVPDHYCPHRLPKHLGRLNLSLQENTPQAISKIIKHGEVGLVMSGDTLTTITYGTDIAAKTLGVLDKLPCVVIIDPLPQKELCVINFDRALLNDFINILRKSLQKTISFTPTQSILNHINAIHSVNKNQTALMNELGSLQKKQKIINEKLRRLTIKIENIKLDKSTGNYDLLTAKQHEISKKAQGQQQQLEIRQAEISNELLNLREKQCSLLAKNTSYEPYLFSSIFKSELKKANLNKNIGKIKGKTYSFLSHLSAPDSLLKLFENFK